MKELTKPLLSEKEQYEDKLEEIVIVSSQPNKILPPVIIGIIIPYLNNEISFLLLNHHWLSASLSFLSSSQGKNYLYRMAETAETKMGHLLTTLSSEYPSENKVDIPVFIHHAATLVYQNHRLSKLVADWLITQPKPSFNRECFFRYGARGTGNMAAILVGTGILSSVSSLIGSVIGIFTPIAHLELGIYLSGGLLASGFLGCCCAGNFSKLQRKYYLSALNSEKENFKNKNSNKIIQLEGAMNVIIWKQYGKPPATLSEIAKTTSFHLN